MSKPLRPQQAITPRDSDLGDSEGECDGAQGGGGNYSEADTWVEEGYLSDREDEVRSGQRIQEIRLRSHSDEEGEGSGHTSEEENSDVEGNIILDSNVEGHKSDGISPRLPPPHFFGAPISTTTTAEWQRAVDSFTTVSST